MNLIFLDLATTYIPFLVQCTKAAGDKVNPTVDNLIIYEEGGADATFDSTTITGSPFDPAQINSKTGLWGVLVAKSAFTAGKFYIALWEMTVNSITTAKVERYFACNASSFKATGFSTHSAADVATLVLATPSQKVVTDASGYVTANLNGDLTSTMKASVNTEVDSALNTAIPVSPTADSINERIVAIDAEVAGLDGAAMRGTDNAALDSTVAKEATLTDATFGLAILDGELDSILTAVQGIQNVTRYAMWIPERLIRPDSGSKTYRIWLNIYDTIGNMEAPDSVPTLKVLNDAAVQRLAETPMILEDVGRYYYDYTLTNTSVLEGLNFTVKIIEGALTNYQTRPSEVTEFETDLNEILAEVLTHPTLSEIEASTTLAMKAHFVNGSGNITPPANKGIWDALGSGAKSISGLNDVSAADVKTAIEADGSKLDAVYDKLPTGNIGDATAASQTTIINYIDTEIASIINAISALQTDLGDPSVDVTTIYAQILLIKGYVDDLESRLTAARAGYIDNLSGGAVALNSTVAKEATLANATYGLSALKTLIDAIDTSTELQDRFTEIKGAGWTTETLKAIYTLIGTGGANLQAIRDAMKLAPSAGTPADGSIDDMLNAVDNRLDDLVSPIPYVIGLDVQISNIDEFAESITFDEKTAVAPVFVVTKNGESVDLAGKTAYFVIKKSIKDKLANKLLEKEGTISDTNKVTFSFAASDMTITPGSEYIGELSIWESSTCSDRRRFTVIINKVVKESLT
jgi:hypothetical protein